MVEDHVELAESVARVLRREGMAVDVVHDGKGALEHASVVDYDVVVLDRDLPDIHGDEVCGSLVEGPAPARVLMLTASATIADRVEGLTLGADDYLPKPFAYAELVARIRAVARRSATAVPPVLVHGDLRLDPARRVATRADERLALTPKEFAVLECLMEAQGRVVSAEELLDRVWDEAADPFTTTVKATINRLRTKLGAPPVVETVPRGGYRI
ncbi:DNA-binding response regulator OS=Streptomyces alboniger OX=132473 GN=CP975_31820 PE=4 SV=1 [Streptomyces alboniger]